MRSDPLPLEQPKTMTAMRRSRFVTFDGFVSLSTWHQRPDRYRHLELDLR